MKKINHELKTVEVKWWVQRAHYYTIYYSLYFYICLKFSKNETLNQVLKKKVPPGLTLKVQHKSGKTTEKVLFSHTNQTRPGTHGEYL